MFDWLRNLFYYQPRLYGAKPDVYGAKPDVRLQDYPLPIGTAPSDPVGHWVYLGYYVPAGLMPEDDVTRYLQNVATGESLYQCVREQNGLVVVSNDAGHAYRVNPDRVIWIPAPKFKLGDGVRTIVGTRRTGWIAARAWHRKEARLIYLIDVSGKNVARKRHSRRYWETELELV